MVDFSSPGENALRAVRYMKERHPEWFDKAHSMWVDSSYQARRAKESNMNKNINAGDTLTVDGLTDDYLGAEIEVGPVDGFTTRFKVQEVTDRVLLGGLYVALRSDEMETRAFKRSAPVTVITPPPSVKQPDEPTEFGQCIRLEGDADIVGVVADPGDPLPIRTFYYGWMDWENFLSKFGDSRLVVSDPPRWPEEDSEADDADDAKAGDKFHRIEDMPYGWIAKVNLGLGDGWGYVVRYDDGQETHRWDILEGYGETVTSRWQPNGARTVSGGRGEGTTYTLVETVEAHDARVKTEDKTDPKAGDVFTRIEDMPYGWVAKAVDEQGEHWGYVVREDLPFSFGLQHTHRWSGDLITSYRNRPVSEWVSFGEDSVSGGHCQSYTLVETVEDHDKRLKDESTPKAGDVFTRIEDMPYGWIAKVTLEDGGSWGYVVRHDDGAVNHRWDVIGRYGEKVTRDWADTLAGTVSGGGEEGTRYTLVETAENHDSRVDSSLDF